MIMDSNKQFVCADLFDQNFQIECTLGDRLLTRTPVSCIFFFAKAYDCPSLLLGIKTALSDFPFLAGRLVLRGNQLFLDCNNQGILFSSAIHEERIANIISNLDSVPSAMLVDHLKNEPDKYSTRPLLSIIVGYFECGGMSIGVSWHHSVGDMHTLMLFLKAWAAAVNHKASDKPLIVGSRKEFLSRFLLDADPTSAAPLVRHYGRLQLVKAYGKLAFASARTQQRSFYFSTHELERMRIDLSESVGRELSLNDCICAHLGHALIHAGCGQPSIDLGITVNYRKRLGLSALACGNFIAPVFASCSSDSSTCETALRIQSACRDSAYLHNALAATVSFVAGKLKTGSYKQFLPIALNQDKLTLLTTNWSRFGALELAFGNASPFFFMPFGHYKIPWLCGIVEGFHGQGILASIVLPHDMHGEAKQADFSSYLHKYRALSDELPAMVTGCSWIS